MYSVFLICCLALMAALFAERCTRGGRVHINPIFGLLIGTSFYVLLPCSVIAYAPESLAALTAYEDVLTPGNATTVMGFTTALLGATYLGTRLAPSLRRRIPCIGFAATSRRESLRNDSATYLLFASFAALLILAFSIRSFLFTGYDESSLESDAMWSARGAMSSFFSVIYLSICAIFLRGGEALRWRSRIGAALIFLISSVILLSLGARLYVAMALLSMLGLTSMLRDGIPAARLAVYLLGGAAAFGSVGVIRSGSLTDLGSIALNIALEPILTSISLFTLLSSNPPILIGKLYMFAADFQAILPSFLFPAKSTLFERLNDYGYAFEAPVGGYHLYFSALINFGFIGSTLLAVPCGYWLGRLSLGRPFKRRSTALTAVFLTGAMTFTVFRDPFFISIAKNVLVMAIFLPLLMRPMRLFAPLPARALGMSSRP